MIGKVLCLTSVFLFVSFPGLSFSPLAEAGLAPPPFQDSDDEDKESSSNRGSQARTERSVMELLREKITGIAGTGISIVSSGSLETLGSVMSIKGGGEVNFGEKSLLADEIYYDGSTGELRAEGNVVLLDKGLRIAGDSLVLNLNDNTGKVINPILETEEGFYVSGEVLYKESSDEYRLEGAHLTSCSQPNPYWRIRAGSIKIKVGETATFSNMKFELLNVPVLYFPWMQLPVNKERGSGFLMPTFGSSDLNGNWINTRYFWAINRSHDASVGLDWYEKRGQRYFGEYRNNLGDNNFLEAHIFLLVDDKRTNNDRYESRLRGRQSLPLGFTATADIQFLSDLLYRRDFINENIYYSPYYRKSASLTNNSHGVSFLVGYKDLNRFRGTRNIDLLRYLPIVDVRTRDRHILNTPFYVSLAANFVRPSIINITRRRGLDELVKETSYNRMDLQGEIRAPLKTFAPWLTISPRVLVRNTRYSKSLKKLKVRTIFDDEFYNRRYYDAGVDITGPVVSKVYGRPGESETLYKHIIEPRLSYLYRSDIEDPQKIIVVDQEDTFFPVHEVRWSLVSRLMRKRTSGQNPQGSTVEVFRFGVSQYVSVDEDLLTSYDKRFVFDPSDIAASSRFSPLTFTIQARLSRHLRAYSNIEFDLETNEFVNYTMSANLNYGFINYNVGWFKSIGIVRFLGGGTYRSNSNRLVSSGSISAFDGMLNLRGAIDYDFIRERYLNYLFGADLSNQCLGIKFEVRKFDFLGQNDLQFRYGLIVGGLKSIFSGQK